MRNFLITILSVFAISIQLVAQNNCSTQVTVTKDPTKSGWNVTANPSGLAPFTYTWSNGNHDKSIYVESQGEYCVTVVAADSCVSKACGKVITNSGCQVTIQQTATGNLEAFPIGVAPFTYLWKTPAGQFTDKSIKPTVAGEYCVQITDANKCTSIACFTYKPKTDSCVVRIEAAQSGNVYKLTAVYYPLSNTAAKFIWNTGATTQTISTEKPGTYCVTVNFGSCTANTCITIGKIDSNQCSVRIIGQKVGIGVYRLRAISTGKAPFKYLWSTGETKNFIFVGMEKEYCVTITDATGCKATACIKVGTIVTPPSVCAVVIQQGNTGELMALAKGLPPYMFTWTGPNGFTAHTQSIKPPTPGEYCVQLITGDSCRAKACFTVNDQPCGVEIIKNSTGTEIIANAKGVGPLTYLWTGPNGFTATTQGIKPPVPGEYCVKITAANGCTAKACVNFNNPPCSVNISISNSGELIANPTGKDPIVYKWTGPNGFTSDKKGFLPTVPGEYCVKILTSDSCEAKACIAYSSCSVVIKFDGPTPGALIYKLFANPTGSGIFKFKWSTGDTTQTINGSAGKEYCVTVTSNNCTAKACITIPSVTPCSVSITSDTVSDGKILYLNAHPTGTGPFKFLWSNGSTDQIIRVAEKGEYCVTVTDAKGCVAKACFKKLAVQEQLGEERNGIIGNTVLVYPNPVSDQLRVENKVAEDATVTLFDLSGKLLTQHQLLANSTLDIPMNVFNSGSYILNIKSVSQISNHKIVKQ